MYSNAISLWLLIFLGGSSPKQAGLQAYHNGKLQRAAILLSMAQGRKRHRRESYRRWRAERIRLRYLAGRIALMRKRPKEAIVYFKKAARNSGLFRDYILLYLGEAYLKAGQPKLALKTYRSLLKEYGRRDLRRQVRRKMLQALNSAKDWAEHGKLLKKLLWYPRPYGGRKRILWKLLKSYVKAKNTKEAAYWLRRYPLEYPLSKEAKRARRYLNRWIRYRKAKATPWTESERLYRLGRMVWQLPKKAMQRVKRWKQSTTGSGKKIQGLRNQLDMLHANSLMYLRKYKEAIPIWEYLYKRYRSVPYQKNYISRKLGRAYREIGEYEKALKILYALAERAPESRKARGAAYRAAWMAMRLQRYKLARRLFKEYRTVYPGRRKERLRIQWFEAWTLFREGRYRKATKAFKKWGRVRRSYYARKRADYWIARSYERSRRWKKAQKLYKSLTETIPFRYYGILAQYRLLLLETLIPMHGDAGACHLASHMPKAKVLPEPKPFGKSKASRRKRHTKPLLISRELFQASSLRWDPMERRRAVRLANHLQNRRKGFPNVPRHCRRSTQSRSCKYMRRAEFFNTIGFEQEAAYELYRAKYLLIQSKKRLLASIRWFLSKGHYHQALRLTFQLSRKRRVVPELLSPRELLRFKYPLAFTSLLQGQYYCNQIPFAFPWAIMRTESHFKVVTRSWAGAQGLMQIMPSTGRKIAKRLNISNFTVPMLYKPKMNVKMGCWYLTQLLQKFESNIMLAAAAYNAGPHRVAAWLQTHRSLDADEFVEEITYNETRKYVKSVFRSYSIYNYLYRQALPAPPTAVAVKVGQNINF